MLQHTARRKVSEGDALKDFDEARRRRRANRCRRMNIASACHSLYGECMARLISTTIRLDEEDVRALKRARAAGHSASDLVRKGLRVVASRYYSGRRPPSTGLFESTDAKLGRRIRAVSGSRRLSRPIIADTGGLLRALARAADGRPSFPEYETALTSATLVIVPGQELLRWTTSSATSGRRCAS